RPLFPEILVFPLLLGHRRGGCSKRKPRPDLKNALFSRRFGSGKSAQVELSSCQVLLAVIGRQWLSLADSNGRRRIEDESDYVRQEIETALNRGIRVIPLLVDGATPPRPADLPVCLEGLAYIQMMSIRPDPDFHADLDRLINQLHQESG